VGAQSTVHAKHPSETFKYYKEIEIYGKSTKIDRKGQENGRMG
jgi:hypothetical protein